MSTTLWMALAAAVVVALGYLQTMRVLFRQSRDLDKHIDYQALRPWKDEPGKD